MGGEKQEPELRDGHAGTFLGLPPRMESELLYPLKAPSRHSHSRCQHLLGGSIENSSRGGFDAGSSEENHPGKVNPAPSPVVMLKGNGINLHELIPAI